MTVRIAVHAVRRAERVTVLDWSITPVSAPGFAFGEDLPPTDLGMEPGTRSSPAITLLDVAGRRAYQPLVHSSREEFNHCLCTPMLRVQPALRVGETRLLQVAFPALPDSLDFVDVGWNTVAPFWHVPVSPLGTAPVAVRPTDLARPESVLSPDSAKLDFANPSGSEQIQRIEVTRVLAAPGRTTLEWRLTSMTPQDVRVLDYRSPVEGTTPLGVEIWVEPGERSGAPRRLHPAAQRVVADLGLQPRRVRVPVHRDRPVGIGSAERGRLREPGDELPGPAGQYRVGGRRLPGLRDLTGGSR